MRGPAVMMMTALLALAVVSPAFATIPMVSVRARFGDPAKPMLVVAHRACHNPAPRHRLPASTPENSLAGIERCIAIGVDIAEIDVRRTRDGFLVLMHDETVDRTTNGRGRVADISLKEIQALHLRENEGGTTAALTKSRVATLDEALALAKGRILLNLDVQAGLYVETVAAVRRTGLQDQAVVKQPAGMGSPTLADTPPFDAVPFMPVLVGDANLPEVAARQSRGRTRPVALELPRMSSATLPALSAVANRAGVRLWANSLWEGFIEGYGGDVDALRDPDAVWGRMRAAGISIIQTDEPEALLHYLDRLPRSARR